MKKNNQIFIPVIILLVAILVYVLGFSSNLAYANKSFILEVEDYPIFDFNQIVQPFNNILFIGIIILFLMLLAVYMTNSHSRTRYLKSNVISISILSGGLIVFAIINFVKLPSLIQGYNALLDNPSNKEELIRLATIYNLIPNNMMYYIGLVLATISLLYAIFMIYSLIVRMKKQKVYLDLRSEVLANAK